MNPVVIEAEDGIVKDVHIGPLRIARWDGWCLKSPSVRRYLLELRRRSTATFELNGEALEFNVRGHGLFNGTVTKAECGCGCGELIVWTKRYVPDHGPPFFVSGHPSKLQTDNPGRFKKGHVPWTKGKKGYSAPGSEKGWFKKGHYSERWKDYPTPGMIFPDGYAYAKSEDPDDVYPSGARRYVSVARSTMEKVLGRPLEKNEVVMHLDGDKGNDDLTNLKVVTRSEAIDISREKVNAGKPAPKNPPRKAVQLHRCKVGSIPSRIQLRRYYKIRVGLKIWYRKEGTRKWKEGWIYEVHDNGYFKVSKSEWLAEKCQEETKKAPERKKSVTPRHTVTEKRKPAKKKVDPSPICPKCKTLKPPMSVCPRCG